jgi:hypothetical protein
MVTTKYVSDSTKQEVLEKVRTNASMNAMEKAILLIIEAENALARGTKHYDVDGKPLTSVLAIITALYKYGRIQLEPAEGEKHVIREIKSL